MNQTQVIRNQIAMIKGRLTKENKAYMGKLNGYMVISSAFHNQEEAVNEQLLTIYQDVLEAQADGMTAEEYLGKNSKQLADALLADLPPIKWYHGLRLTGALALVYLSIDFLSEFSSTGQMVYQPMGLVCDLLLGLLLPATAFFIIKSTFYQESRLKSFLSLFAFGSLFMGTALVDFYSLLNEQALSLPVWGVMAILLAIAVGIYAYRKNLIIRYSLLPGYVLSLFSGCFALYLQSADISVNHWLSWTQFGFYLLCVLASIIGLCFAIVKETI